MEREVCSRQFDFSSKRSSLASGGSGAPRPHPLDFSSKRSSVASGAPRPYPLDFSSKRSSVASGSPRPLALDFSGVRSSLSAHARSGAGGPGRASISSQLKKHRRSLDHRQRRSLELINEVDNEELQEVDCVTFEDSCFLELLERLRTEHEREVTVLRTALERSDADVAALEQRYQADLGAGAGAGEPSSSNNISRRSSAGYVTAFEQSEPSSSNNVSQRSSAGYLEGCLDGEVVESQACASKIASDSSPVRPPPLWGRSYSLSVIPAPPAEPQELYAALPELLAKLEESKLVEASKLVESVCKAEEDTVSDGPQSRPMSPRSGGALSPDLESDASGGGNHVGQQTIAEEPDLEMLAADSMPAAELPGITNTDEVASNIPDENQLIAPSPSPCPSMLGGLNLPRGFVKSNSFQTGAAPALPRIPGFGGGLRRSNSALRQPRGSALKDPRNSARQSALKKSGSMISRQSSVAFDDCVDDADDSSDGSVEGFHEVQEEKRERTSNDVIVPLAVWQPMMDQQEVSQTKLKKADLSRCLSGDNLSSFGENAVKSFVGSYGAVSKKPGVSIDSLVGHPSSSFNFCCDLASMFFIFYDLVTIPLGVFDIDDWLFFRLMRILITLFWTTDFVRHFFKGYYAQGDVVVTFRPVAIHYLKTWAAPDACLVCLDWLEWFLKIMDSTELSPGVAKVFRLMRNARGMRLLRGVKTGQILKVIEDRINSEVTGTIWNMVKFLIFILCATHLMACTWYFIGGVYESSVPNWRTVYIENHPFGETFLWKYTTSFHWAITQFTPASIKVQPENSVERGFAICCLLLAFVSMSSFISGLTSAVMQLRQLSAKKHQEFWLLRKYLMQGQVPTELSVRINNYCQHAWKKRGKKSSEKSVELLQLLSASLRMELKIAMFSPRIANHAFFMLLHIASPNTIRSACNKALTQCEVYKGDDLFSFGEEAYHMFFTEQKELEYKLRAHKEGELVTNIDWVCEACLWSVWSYRGTLTAVCESHAIAVEADAFAKILVLCPDARPEATAYAKSFLAGINREPPWKLTDLYTSRNAIEGLWFRLMKDFHVTRGMNPSTRSLSNARHSSIYVAAMSAADSVTGYCRNLPFAQWFR